MGKNELLDKLKNGLLSVIKYKEIDGLFGPENSKSSTKQKYYLSDLKYNLYKEIIPNFKLGKDPDAVRSSAAMIYNTLYYGDVIVDGKLFKGYSKDGFLIYELPFIAIKDDNESSHTAQLDAGIVSVDGHELILFEAKCMEWIDKNPKGLKKAYLKNERYIHEESASIFVPIFNKLVYENEFKKERDVDVHKPKSYARYDAVQMMIHCLGIYNWCLGKYKKQEENLKIIRLMNLVWNCKDSMEYDEEEKEGLQFEEFANSELKEKFKQLGVDFSVEYVRYSDFLNRVDWSNDMEHRNYLKRYEV